MAKTIHCKTAAQVKKALKNGDTALIMTGAMIAMTLSNQPDATIYVDSGAYLNLTLDSSQATVKTLDSSQATVKTLDSSQATVETLDSSQATVETLDSSQATVKTLDSSQATVKTWGSSQATVETLDSSQATVKTLDSSQATVKTWGSSQATVKTLDSSQATVKTWGSSQATVETLDSSQATVKTLDSSQATVKTWGSKTRLPDTITHIGGEEVATGVPDLLREVAIEVWSRPDSLKMDCWHYCETVHCMSGWSTHKAGARGKELEQRMGNHSAGLVLLGRDAADHFYDSNDEAREWLKQFVPPEMLAGGEG